MFRKELSIVVAGILGCNVHAQFSGSCLSEINIIHSDELIGGFQVDCSQKQVFSCEFDGRPPTNDYDPGIIPYRDRCYELDGKIFWYDSYRECTDDFTDITNRYFWLGLPFCVGKICTLDDFIDQQENVWKPNTIQENLPDTCFISYENPFSLTLSGTCAAQSIVLFDAIEGTWPTWGVPDTSGSTKNLAEEGSVYKTTCLNSGGVIYAVDEVAVECDKFVNGILSPYTSTLLNDAYCVGPSCSLSDVQEYISSLAPSIASGIQEDTRYSSCKVSSSAATKVTVSSTAEPATAAPVPVPTPIATPVVRPVSLPIRVTSSPVMDPIATPQPTPTPIETVLPPVSNTIEPTQNPTDKPSNGPTDELFPKIVPQMKVMEILIWPHSEIAQHKEWQKLMSIQT